ncbi:cas scaffolding protein family member 4 [Orycteropus afer afer]|uniref:Cas scaffolding protein family member 4 n=1 Tax=Orycteropus afer afer TaxID=1230840 RepID=A0A8B7B1Z4_ORYAF|nr:cas scaffolding protein family member 4 [Orycteropus afer afer]
MALPEAGEEVIPMRPEVWALLAKALYDNLPDCSDELAFCRGDILTILEQNVPENEGWWKCVLHGRQGLAPANRLQMLTKAPTDRPCAPLLGGLQAALASSEEAYQVPSLLGPPTPGPVYEHMKSWVEAPPPSTAQVYELLDRPPRARIVCEKTLSFQKQTLCTLPRPMHASWPAPPCQVYDVPAQNRVHSALKECEKQQLYDIPPSPQKAGLRPPASQASGHSVSLTSPVIQREGYNSLPIPQKSEWIYDTPGAPKKASMRNSPLSSLVEERGSHPPLGLLSAFHSPSPDSRTRSLNQQVYKDVPRQKKLSLPEISVSGLPAPRGTYAWDDGVSYKVPSSFLVLRAEQRNTKPNIYDVPKAMSSIPRGVKEPAKAGGVTETSGSPTWLCTWAASRSPEPDSLLVSSSDSSRASVVSSCSSMSTDSSSSSSSEELAKELSVDLNVARETVTALQHKVASAVAGLMLHVSRKWRCREYLEANISAVHRAVDHTEESLREFLDFARGVQELTCNLSDSNLQARIKDQLQAIACSYQILRETKQGLDSCHWSLEVLATEQLPNGPDDLERLVMAARMVPEDVKRFASMVIANGKLLFKQNCEKGETLQLTPNAKSKLENCIQFPQRETESQQRSAPFNKQREPGHSPELVKKNRTNVCGQSPSFLTPQSLSEQNPEKKIHLSEHCRLYFGALFKAISVFTSSLSNSQPPETFITQSKLTIVVGQKLVDTLCQETQERDVRNEILCHSSHLCGLLKNLALATKDAVLHYPSPTALQHLRAQAEKLEQHARQLRAALD